MDTRFDDLLHTIIVEKGQGIYGFFDTVFGFMYRRTDFYYEMAPGENMGFFPGQSEAIIYNFFRKYQNLHYKERVPKRNIDPKEIEEFMKQHKGKVPNNPNLKGFPIEKVQTVNEPDLKTIKIADNSKDELSEKKTDNASFGSDLKNMDLTKSSTENVKDSNNSKINENKNNSTNQKKIDEKFETISTYNGDKCENYSWSQGVMDVSIQVKLPDNTQSSKVSEI